MSVCRLHVLEHKVPLALSLRAVIRCVATAFVIVLATSQTLLCSELGDISLLADKDRNLYWGYENSCGLIAVLAVCRVSGLNVTVEQAAAELPVTASGTSMEALVAFLGRRGLEATPVAIDAQHLSSFLREHPSHLAIAYVAPSHWVMVSPAEGRSIAIYASPTTRVIDHEEFENGFYGKAILVQPKDPLYGLKGSHLALVSCINLAIGIVVFRRSVIR